MFDQREAAQSEDREELKRVNARDLERHMKSKKQLYSCLSMEGKNQLSLHLSIGQVYLPPYGDCTITFI